MNTCGVNIVGKGVDTQISVQTEEDLQIVVAQIRKAIGLAQRAEVRDMKKGSPWDWASDKNMADCCGQASFRLRSRADANRNFAIGWPFAEELIALLDECGRRFDMNNGESK